MHLDLHPATWVDALRVAALVLGAANIAVTLVVTLAYARIYWMFHRHVPADVKWRGLLPRHVAMIGTSSMILTVAGMTDVADYLHDGLTWRPFVYGTAYTMSLWALWDVLGHARHRLHAVSPLSERDLDL